LVNGAQVIDFKINILKKSKSRLQNNWALIHNYFIFTLNLQPDNNIIGILVNYVILTNFN